MGFTTKAHHWRTAISSRCRCRHRCSARLMSGLPSNPRISTRIFSRDLEKIGFKLDFGEDGTGWQFKYLTRGGGYYFNVGCSDMLIEGKIRLIQFDDIAGFTPDGARLMSGDTLAADLIVLSTGYRPQEELVEKLFGAVVAERVGPIWGFGDELELRNMYCRHRSGGSLLHCRQFRAEPYLLKVLGIANQGSPTQRVRPVCSVQFRQIPGSLEFDPASSGRNRRACLSWPRNHQ